MAESTVVDAATWRELTHHRPLAAVIDIDHGPFACNFDVSWHAPTLLRNICEPLRTGHVQVVLVSGARRDAIEHLRDQLPSVWWYIEHGAWRYANRMWSGQAPRRELDSLAAVLVDFAAPTLKITRTTIGLSATWSEIDQRTAAALAAAFGKWVGANPTFRLHVSGQRIEARLATASKADAVTWVRQRLPEVRCLLAALDGRAEGTRDLALSDVEAPAVLRSLAELRGTALPPPPIEVHAEPSLHRARPRGRR